MNENSENGRKKCLVYLKIKLIILLPVYKSNT